MDKEITDMSFEELLSAPTGAREAIGEKLVEAMMTAAKKVLVQEGLTNKQLYHAELRSEEPILDVAVALSHFVMKCKAASK